MPQRWEQLLLEQLSCTAAKLQISQDALTEHIFFLLKGIALWGQLEDGTPQSWDDMEWFQRVIRDIVQARDELAVHDIKGGNSDERPTALREHRADRQRRSRTPSPPLSASACKRKRSLLDRPNERLSPPTKKRKLLDPPQKRSKEPVAAQRADPRITTRQRHPPGQTRTHHMRLRRKSTFGNSAGQRAFGDDQGG